MADDYSMAFQRKKAERHFCKATSTPRHIELEPIYIKTKFQKQGLSKYSFNQTVEIAREYKKTNCG